MPTISGIARGRCGPVKLRREFEGGSRLCLRLRRRNALQPSGRGAAALALGKTRIALTREGEVAPEQQQHGLSGRSEVTELHDLLAPDEISRLFARSDPFKRQLVIWAGFDPLILQRVEYFDAAGPLRAALEGQR
ncbi:MAG: hypothetical protein AB7K04_01865 [Pseudorhodoplanes sp.]